jgi:hypothetical protein
MLSTKDLHGIRRDEYWQCRALWLATYIAVLPAAIGARLTGWRWQPWPPRADGYGSVFKEADSLAKTIVGITYGAQ